MARIVDNLIAYRVLMMLVTPFEDTEAYKLGIIDKTGKNLIKMSNLDNEEQKASYTYLHRLVFNLKKILNKLPGGDSKLKNIVAAMFLLKETYEGRHDSALLEDSIKSILDSNAILVEETIFVEQCLKAKKKELEEDGAPANVTGAAVSTDAPVIRKKELNKYKAKNAGVVSLARRNAKVM
jgi:hypothetical protein